MMASSSTSVLHHHNGAAVGGTSTTREPPPPLRQSLSQTGDTATWLHNKLGTSNDLWSDTSSIITQLNRDILSQVKHIFQELQVNVKLKLLLAFLHISRRNLEEWKESFEEVLEVAAQDTDQWVSVIGAMLKNYPRHGTICYDVESTNNQTFFELVNEIKKCVKKQGDKGILPLDALYLNKNAFTGLYQLPALQKHFTVRRKPKSAQLRAELLQKAQDASSGKRPTTASVGVRYRGLNNDSAPLKGIPSRSSFGSSSSSTFGSSFGSSFGGRSSLSSIGGFSRLTSSLGGTSSGGPRDRLARLTALANAATGTGGVGGAAAGGGTSGVVATTGVGGMGGSGKRESGIKFLDIIDIPTDPKRRKKEQQQAQQAQKQAELKEAQREKETSANANAGGVTTNKKSNKDQTVVSTTEESVQPQQSQQQQAQPVFGHKSGGTPDIPMQQIGKKSTSTESSTHSPSSVATSISSSSLLAQHLAPSRNSTLSSLLTSPISASKSGSGSLFSNTPSTIGTPTTPSSPFFPPSSLQPSTPTSPSPSTFYGKKQQPSSSQAQPQSTLSSQVPSSYRPYLGSVAQQPPPTSTTTTTSNTPRGMYSNSVASAPVSTHRSMYDRSSSVSGQSSVIQRLPSTVAAAITATTTTTTQATAHQSAPMVGMYGNAGVGVGTQSTVGPATTSTAAAAVPVGNLATSIVKEGAAAIPDQVFGRANCLSPPEHDMILRFLAGVQPHPAPQMGPLLMIKYREELLEKVAIPGGPSVKYVEVEHFLMNFHQLEWATLKSTIAPVPGEKYGMGVDALHMNQTRVCVVDPTKLGGYMRLLHGSVRAEVAAAATGVGTLASAQPTARPQAQVPQYG